MKELNYLDGFSGYGGFTLALRNAGFKFKNHYFSEMDKHAIANYKYNFPNSIYAGLIQHITRNTIPNIDLFTFGWPCQDNSIAGKRKGQSGGGRSSLLFEAVRIINEFKPRNFIAENVAGLFSVNAGVDFFKTLEILAYLNQSCPQYDIEMQLCNTRWVLPQNRERLFFVGHLRGSDSKQVFPIGENNSSIDGVQGQGIASNTLTARYAGAASGGAYIIEDKQLQITTNTKAGFEVAKEGDSINYSVLGSKTRRGRVGDGIAQTLDTACNQAVVVRALTETRSEEAKLIRKESMRQGKDFSPRRGKKIALRNDGVMNTMTASPSIEQLMMVGKRIRRYTEIEAERLQGLPDNWTKWGNYDGEIKEISSTQRYKLCGNGVSEPIVRMLAKKLYDLNYK